MKTFASSTIANSNFELENSLTEAQREELINTFEAEYTDIQIGDQSISDIFYDDVNFRMMFMICEKDKRKELCYAELRKNIKD